MIYKDSGGYALTGTLTLSLIPQVNWMAVLASFFTPPVIVCVAVVATAVVATAVVAYGVVHYVSTSTASTDDSAHSRKKPNNLPKWKKLTLDMDHITSGHMPGGSRNPDGKKTVFFGLTAEQLRRAIEEAYSTCKKLQTQYDRVLVEGYSPSTGYTIQMWINLVTLIIETAYPVN